jgi:hypothetical protein
MDQRASLTIFRSSPWEKANTALAISFESTNAVPRVRIGNPYWKKTSLLEYTSPFCEFRIDSYCHGVKVIRNSRAPLGFWPFE